MSDDEGDHSHYNNGNRAFLQAVMARGTITMKEGQLLLAEIFSIQEGRRVDADNVTSQDFATYIAAANSALSPFDYEISSAQHQLTKTRIWAVTNLQSDAMTQLATTHSPEEIGYIKRVLDAMFETYNTKRREVMAITSMQALKKEVVKPRREDVEEGMQEGRGLTVQEAEKCLGQLVGEGWLELSRDSYYSLTPRALMELRGWLVATYNSNEEEEEEGGQKIKFCEACKEIVTIGQRCAEVECPMRLHDVCLGAFWKSKPNKQCPKCKTEWIEDRHYVGQRCITRTEEYLREKRRNGVGAVRRRTRDEVEEEQEEKEETMSSPPMRTGRDGGRRGREQEPDEDENEDE
ncbi:Nse1 non-SMC component of SMC5-6 complex-domain-containing protein [Bisporella sp. PMI_857]|nr:Nse1 non-SMC component of SMC5-6 complex-domain-containing protein [Bisporella sp. PMI_857]